MKALSTIKKEIRLLRKIVDDQTKTAEQQKEAYIAENALLWAIGHKDYGMKPSKF